MILSKILFLTSCQKGLNLHLNSRDSSIGTCGTSCKNTFIYNNGSSTICIGNIWIKIIILRKWSVNYFFKLNLDTCTYFIDKRSDGTYCVLKCFNVSTIDFYCISAC